MTTVCCVYVKGPYPYTPEYVTRLERMARRHLADDFAFVCLTDQPWLFRDPIQTVPIPSRLPGCEQALGYWTKLQLFNPARTWTGRVLFLDLDVLVVAGLAPLVNYPAPFALVSDELALDRPAIGTNSIGQTIIRRFNASALAFDAGSQTHLWERWTPEVTQRLQSDQDWYGEQCPDAAAMPVEWFPRISKVQPPWPEAAKVVLVKKPKNHLAAKQWDWFEPMWGGWAA